MKQEHKPGNMYWEVMHYNCNAKRFESYNVLWYREEFIKKLKKKVASKEEFAQEMKSEFKHRFWSKCEWELVLSDKDGRIVMSPLIGPEDVTLDVTDRENFDWVDFFNKQMKYYSSKREIKIDVWDQINYKFDEFIDYTWNFHHKWQRRKKDEL